MILEQSETQTDLAGVWTRGYDDIYKDDNRYGKLASLKLVWIQGIFFFYMNIVRQ